MLSLVITYFCFCYAHQQNGAYSMNRIIFEVLSYSSILLIYGSLCSGFSFKLRIQLLKTFGFNIFGLIWIKIQQTVHTSFSYPPSMLKNLNQMVNRNRMSLIKFEVFFLWFLERIKPISKSKRAEFFDFGKNIAKFDL